MADESFSGMISQIKNNICKHGVYTPYVKFTVLNTKYGDFTFTTNDPDRCMITSFENVKNGSGQANSFSVTISFSPSTSLFYKSNNIDYSNINLIDEILNLNKESLTTTDDNGNTTGSTLRKCKIQYGYSYPKLILSPEYEGAILDYTTEISNGILIYTITGYSGVSVSCKDIVITIEGSGEGEEAETKKPTEIVKDIFEKYIKGEGVTDYELEFAPDTEGTDKEIEIPTAQNVTVFQYIKTVLDSAEYSEDDENTEAEKRSIYTYTISDKDKKIRVERYNPTDKQTNAEKDAVRFSWMGPTEKDSGYDYSSNAMVIDFKTNFKGSVSMAYDYSKYVKTKSGIDSSGNTVKASGTSVPTAGSNTKNDSAVNLNLWATRLQYMYTATLVTVGIPYEVQILSNIYVAPMILGQEHFTGGLYKITKTTDVIDTSGFTTTFELARNQAPTLQEQYNELLKEKEKMGNPSNASDGQRMTELNNKISEYEALDPSLNEGVD